MPWYEIVKIILVYSLIILLYSLYDQQYWRDNLYRPHKPKFWNRGWLIEVINCIFGFLNFISPSRLISWIIEKKRSKRAAYHFVDSWVFSSLAILLLIFFSNIFNFSDLLLIPAGWVVWAVGFRMADLFQSWFNHFVLGGVPKKWNPVDPTRSLVIVFMGYFEIVIAYSILAYNYKDSFKCINSLQDSFMYSIGNAITIGSTNIKPEGLASYIILSTQLILVLVFLTAVVQHIINYSRSK